MAEKLISVASRRTGTVCYLVVPSDWEFISLNDEYFGEQVGDMDWPDFLKQRGAKDAISERWGH